MQKRIFDTSAHAKCILAGEHAVMRSCPAIVVPIPDKMISLHHEEFDQPLRVKCNFNYEDIFLVFFWNTVKTGLEKLHHNLNDIRGELTIDNTIPMGAGIGFSSALSVAVSRWFVWKEWLEEDKLFEFASQLENIFHGTSSGVDIAGAIANNIIHFEKSGHICKKILAQWQPKMYISYSGNTKNTLEAVNQVKTLYQKHKNTARIIDKEMMHSVRLIEQGLRQNPKKGMELLAAGIEHAHHCFHEWHLITPELQSHIDTLYGLGAVAVKPTGAGIGGYVLSLWDKKPPSETVEFIPLFESNTQ